MNSAFQLPLIAVILALSAATPSFANSDPKGEGPANSVVCRQSEYKPGSHISEPKVCLKNWQWAKLRTNHLTVTGDGQRIVSLNYVGAIDGYRSLNEQSPAASPMPSMSVLGAYSLH